MAYNKKIEIQSFTEAQDDIGNDTQEWTTLLRPWAEIITAKSQEYYAAAQVNSEKDYVFKIRYSRIIAGKLSSELRILYNDRYYDIKHIDDVNEQHRQIVLRAEVRNEGVR